MSLRKIQNVLSLDNLEIKLNKFGINLDKDPIQFQ